MRSSIFVIMRKELARFFGDRRMVVSILMPGILIYILYSFMGEAMGESFGVEEHFTPTVYAVELPDSISDVFPISWKHRRFSCLLLMREVDWRSRDGGRDGLHVHCLFRTVSQIPY